MDQQIRFTSKKALVTGAAGGIGSALVSALRRQGAPVAAADRDTASVDADVHLPGDLLETAYTEGLPAAAAKALGGLDIVVNNAGIITRGPVTETSNEDLCLSLGVNVEAPLRICRAAIPILAAKGGGAIVNTASCWGIRPGAKSCALLHDQGGHRFVDAMHGTRSCASGHSRQRRVPQRSGYPNAAFRIQETWIRSRDRYHRTR